MRRALKPPRYSFFPLHPLLLFHLILYPPISTSTAFTTCKDSCNYPGTSFFLPLTPLLLHLFRHSSFKLHNLHNTPRTLKSSRYLVHTSLFSSIPSHFSFYHSILFSSLFRFSGSPFPSSTSTAFTASKDPRNPQGKSILSSYLSSIIVLFFVPCYVHSISFLEGNKHSS